MEKITKQIELGKEVSELADGMGNLVVASYIALKDGFQVSQDVPAMLTAAVVNLPVAMGGLEKLGEEWTTDEAAFILAFVLAGKDAFKKIKDLKAATPVA